MAKAWDQARAVSRRELPKPRKMLGPIGEPKPGNEGVERCYARGFGRDKGNSSTFFASGQCSTCKHCGYHVCSCNSHIEALREWLSPGALPLLVPKDATLIGVDLGSGDSYSAFTTIRVNPDGTLVVLGSRPAVA